MQFQLKKLVGRVLALSFAGFLPLVLAAQTAPAATGIPKDADASKWDIFLGYSYLRPGGAVAVNLGYEIYDEVYHPIDYGAIMSVSRYFNRHVGVTFEGDEHILSPETGNNWISDPGNDFSGGSGGIIYRWPAGNITPFVHALVGAEQTGTFIFPEVWGPVVTAGGGLDVKVSHHLSIRMVQADYQWTRENVDALGDINFNMLRLSGGLVLNVGSIAPPTSVQLSCTPNPVTVFPGDPVTITATVGMLEPKMNAIYSWSGSGATGTGTTVTINTGTLAPGSYTVTGTVKEGKHGREGVKPWETATCSAVFTVKAFEPPTISCSANPSSISPGDKSTITCNGVSPQNRPLTYSYSAVAGSIQGTTNTATFDSTGAPTGPVTITGNVSDDKGQTATANTSVTIAAPYVPPVPHSQALCSISFNLKNQPPDRVDNEAKACLDQVAVDLQNQADAKVVVVGESTADEKAPKKGRHHEHEAENLAAQRAVNTKDYLVTDKGIDASRVIVVTGSTDGQTVEDYLVPSGATFTNDVQGTTPVDESTVKPQVRKPLGAVHHHKKEAAPAQ